jgi:hypothetical protein
MRPLSFRSDELRSLLLRNKLATLDELKQALGTSVNVSMRPTKYTVDQHLWGCVGYFALLAA